MPNRAINTRLKAPTQRVVLLETRRPAFCVALSCTVTFILGTVFAFTAWNLAVNQFNSDRLDFHDGDEVATSDVSKDFSSVFCDAFEISTWHHATVILLPGQAKVNQSERVTTHLDIHEMTTKSDDIRAYYLLTGSTIKLEICRQSDAINSHDDICIVKGAENYKEYRERGDHHVKRCLVYSDITGQTSCTPGNDTAKPIEISLKVNDSDHFFIILNYGRGHHDRGYITDKPGIILNGTVTRTQYDTSQAEVVCQAHEHDSCTFLLPWNSDKDIVVQMDAITGNNNAFTGNNGHKHETIKTSFKTRCNLRVIFWVGLFGLIPLLISVAVSIFFAHLFCRRRRRAYASVKRQAKRKRKSTEKDSLVQHEVFSQDSGGGSMAIQDA